MLQDEVTSHDLQKTFCEMVSSVRELNRRIDELKYVVKSEYCTVEGKTKIIARIARLMETKLCIIYSIHDIRIRLINTYAAGSVERIHIESMLDLETLYRDLKSI
jgi:hypothetical protein